MSRSMLVRVGAPMATLLWFLSACSSGSGSSPNPDGGAPPATGDICGAMCSRINSCDNTQDTMTCTDQCDNACAAFWPKARPEVTSAVDDCFAQKDCETVLGTNFLGQCLAGAMQLVAASSAGVKLCTDVSNTATQCGLSFDQPSCLAAVKVFSDDALQQADACTAKACTTVSDCLKQALPGCVGVSVLGSSSPDAGAPPVDAAPPPPPPPPPADAGPDPGCQASGASCASCCTTAYQAGAQALVTDVRSCACAAGGPCASACATEACVGKSTMKGDACDTCISASLASGGACEAQVAAECQANASCTALLTCTAGCPH